MNRPAQLKIVATMPLPSLATIIQLYTADMAHRVSVGGIAAASAKHQRHFLDSFAAMFGDTNLADAKQHNLSEWIESQPGWKSPSTLRHAVYAVLACFRWAESEGLIDRNPYRVPKLLNLQVQPRPALEPYWYVRVLRVACSNRAFRRALFFVRRTGCRLCEMRAMTWDQIDFVEGVVRLPVKDNKTGAFSRRFLHFARLAGVPAEQKAYALRHAYCMAAIENGIGERQVADQLGHSSTRMVSWYARETRNRNAHLRNVANQAMRRAKGA